MTDTPARMVSLTRLSEMQISALKSQLTAEDLTGVLLDGTTARFAMSARRAHALVRDAQRRAGEKSGKVGHPYGSMHAVLRKLAAAAAAEGEDVAAEVPVQWSVLTESQVRGLHVVVTAAENDAAVAWVTGELVTEGTARQIVCGPDDFTSLPSTVDVRDGFLRVTLARGVDVAWPVGKLVQAVLDGRFLVRT